jgi:hypothetical protein
MVLVLLLLQKFIRSRRVVIAIGATLFSAGRFKNSLQSAVITIWPGIEWVYASVHWRERTGSWRPACGAAFRAHALHNLYYFPPAFMPASWIL